MFDICNQRIGLNRYRKILLQQYSFITKDKVTGSPFKIYNASAGSGKTHTLTKEYLKIVLSTPKSFGNILALTFTNKAVGEMKHRILDSLFEFGRTFDIQGASPLFLDVQQELLLDPEVLRMKAEKTLKEILHNYAFFDIATIDKFTHRLIRTFAKDLKLPQNFEVVLDNELLLSEAVSRLILKAGEDPLLTQVLIEFAFEKIDDDKSWDIAIDLAKIGKLLFNENHALQLEKLREKTIPEFLALKKILKQRRTDSDKEMVAHANECLTLIKENGLQFTDFTRSSFPNFMQKIAGGDLQVDFDAGWKKNFSETLLYNKSCDDGTKAILDGLHPQFTIHFQTLQKAFYETARFKNAYGNIVPLTVLNSLQHEVKQLQLERDQLSISEFNGIISKEIKNQPAPFIYERLGEKYMHYFIDEFQDTSTMQWENLTPLLGNGLERQDEMGNTGSLFLVGDAKQAIYRWRGGRAEQFLDLILKRTYPFVIPQEVHSLPTNYRSHVEIVQFNNTFFKATAAFLNSELYQQLFIDGNEQLSNSKKGGYVQLTFVDEEDEAQTKHTLYANAVIEKINTVLAKGHPYTDICILVRNNKDGVQLAQYLTERQIPVISSESLLLKSSEEVRFLIDLLKYQNQPDDLAARYHVLAYLSKEKEPRHEFIAAHLENPANLLKETYGFDLRSVRQKSVYDGLEFAIKQFNLAKDAAAYLIFLMDVVLEVEQKEGTGLHVFLAYWEKKKDALGLSAPDHLNAVQIMTVHKAKGLEFPVVIFPYANEHLYKRMDKKIWLPVEPTKYEGFEALLFNEKKEIVQYGEKAAHSYQEEEEKMELDAFNVLYVALTRAEKALFIITRKQLDKKGNPNTDYYSGLFITYLQGMGQWDETKTHFEFGSFQESQSTPPPVQPIISFPYTQKERPGFKILTKTDNLWDTERAAALSKGNLIHLAMGLIETPDDIENALSLLTRKGDVKAEEVDSVRTTIQEIVNHPQLAPYFSKGSTIKNEKDIITKNGQLLRPDRLVIKEKQVTILDYKTGKKNVSYHQQLASYAQVLEQMGYVVENKIIIYIDELITPEFIP